MEAKMRDDVLATAIEGAEMVSRWTPVLVTEREVVALRGTTQSELLALLPMIIAHVGATSAALVVPAMTTAGIEVVAITAASLYEEALTFAAHIVRRPGRRALLCEWEPANLDINATAAMRFGFSAVMCAAGRNN